VAKKKPQKKKLKLEKRPLGDLPVKKKRKGEDVKGGFPPPYFPTKGEM
jgi:hypothetical protein